MKQQYSPKQTAAMKARVRRMRAQFKRRLIAAIIIFFILGIVAGVFAHRWYVGQNPDVAGATNPVTPEPADAEVTPEPEQTPDAWALPGEDGESDEDIFPVEDSEQGDAGAELDAFPEVGFDDEDDEEESALANQAEQTDAGDANEPQALIAPGEILEPQPTEAAEEQAETQDGEPAGAENEESDGVPAEEQPAGADEEPAEEPAGEAETGEEQPEATEAPDMASDDVPEYDPEEAEVPEEYLTVPDENGIVEAEEGQALTNYGPQVVAIVPYGESFTYTTEIDADGNARVEATDAPYETISFTQTMKSFMRPTDFANKYATKYKLTGDEAGAGFELVLNDYTGAATIVPQNVVDVSLRSESGNTVERGYQLMDSEIDGQYGVALTSNIPKTLYKRYQYSSTGEEMAYLVITTYTGGNTQMILFELESNEPEPEPEVIYTILQKGLKGEEVVNLQNRLIELGYLSGTADGTFGQQTEDAIRAAQAAFGMEQTGIADNAFQQRLYEGAAPDVAQAEGYVTLSEGSTGDAVVRLQKRLAELGFYEGKADGGYGPMMVAAVKKAQAIFGMEQTGVADEAFQQRAFAGLVDEDEGEDYGYATLDTSSTGEAVVQLQLSLREQGFYSGRADGGYGPNTVAAVKKAQTAFGMEPTGIADGAFQHRLFGDAEATDEPEAATEAEAAAETEEDASTPAENTVG